MGKLVAEYSTKPPPNPTTSFTATDQLGSPRVITNSLGEVISRRDFQPFGEELLPDATYRKTLDKYGVTDSVRQRFTGYQKDIETGLDFAEARMYENRHGRFTAVDPLLASGKSANPQTFNRYVYVINNPLAFIDPEGLQVTWRGDVYVNADQTSFRNYQTEGFTRFTGTPKEINATDGYRYRIRPTGVRPLGKVNPDAGDVAYQGFRDTVVGVGGTLYNGSAGLANLFGGIANRANLHYFSTGVPRNEFPTFDYIEMETPGEQSASFATSFGMLYFGAASGARSPAPSFSGFTTEQATGPVTVFRVEGTANQMLSIRENGSVSVTGNRMLFLNFGDVARAESFAARRVAQGMEGVEIKSFQVNRAFFNDVRNSAVPESMRSIFPTSPIRVDTRFSNQFGIPRCQFSSLCNNIIPGSGRSVPIQ